MVGTCRCWACLVLFLFLALLALTQTDTNSPTRTEIPFLCRSLCTSPALLQRIDADCATLTALAEKNSKALSDRAAVVQSDGPLMCVPWRPASSNCYACHASLPVPGGFVRHTRLLLA